MGVLLLVSALAGVCTGGQTDRPPQEVPGSIPPLRPHWLSGDLHLMGGVLLSDTAGPGQSLMVCQEGFSMVVGSRRLKADRGMVWIVASPTPAGGTGRPYRVQAYLAGRVSDSGAADRSPADLTVTVLERGRALVVAGRVGGEVFVTADRKGAEDPRGAPLYQEAVVAFHKAGLDLPPGAEQLVPPEPARVRRPPPDRPPVEYTINISPLTDVVPKYERSVSEEGVEISTYIGRSYVSWQERGETGDPGDEIELQADSVVVWRTVRDASRTGTDQDGTSEEGVTAIYVSGDVIMRQGQRTIQAEDLYYDLRQGRALARNVVMRTFDTARNIPIYVRAREFRQVAEDVFEAEEVTLTSSEFWTPQLSLEAARVRIIDRQDQERREGAFPDSGFDVELRDVKFKVGDATLMGVRRIHSRRTAPELPIRSVRGGYDRAFGPSVETSWWLSRLLGLREPEGTDGTVSLDYYGRRGVGGGADLIYERENYFGSILGYIIQDQGEDRLSRTRKNVEVPDNTRGRFQFQHRHFLPYDWQMTAEVSYLSDENFLEQFYRTEFNVGKEQETLLHFKRIQDNWGLSLLGKTRINDFVDQVEELPTVEYHLMGQSLFNDRFTFYSDSQVSRYRYRYRLDPADPARGSESYFTFVGTRNELDLPLSVGAFRVVPFVAGTFGYEDGPGFQAELGDGLVESREAIAIGEAGVRMSMQPFWSVYPNVESRFFDLHQLRHVIRPSLTAVAYAESDPVARQRDTLHFGVSQRFQTKRGPVGRRRTVDWLEWDVDFVWVADPREEFTGPDRFLWSEPFIPLVNRDGRVIPPVDRRTTDLFGPRQNHISTDVILRLTDTTAILGDLYFNTHKGVVEQVNVGFSRLVWPNLSYYVGSRYLRRVEHPFGERSSNALTFAATYVLNARYTAVFAEQFDLRQGTNIRTDLTLIRKYHRMNLALTFSLDESRDERRIMLSLWPEGIPELAIGMRGYMGLGASDVYY